MKTRQLAGNLMLLITIGLVATGIGNAWADTQQISLSSGWNFISLQIEPNVPDIENVLSGLDVESVWYYDAIRAMNGMDPWLCHKPDNPAFLNNLHEIHARKAYWIEMHSPGALNIEGQMPTTSITCYPGYDGETGWNAVGFFSPTNNYTVEELLESDVYDSIWGYNPAGDSFIQLDTNDVLEPGKAYWIETPKGFELAPDIEVSPTVFHFGSQGEKGLIQLRNRGDGEIDWQAMAYTDDGWNWLGLKEFLDDEEDPATQLAGWVSFYYKPIYIFIDRGGLAPGEYTGHIRVVASAKPDFPVDVEVTMTVEPIGGDYSGTVVINKVDGKNIPEISTRLFASIHYDANEGIDVMTVINSEKSLIFPHDPILSGGIIDTNTSLFSVVGTLLLAEDDSFNPYPKLKKAISRQIWLETTILGSGNNMLGGVYGETIQGLLGKPIEAEGVFQLHKVDDTPFQDASDRFGYLEGTVIDDVTGQPITGATVILTGTGITEYSTTLGNGAFSFYVPDFVYLLNAQAPGYESVHQNENFDHTSPESITIRLVPVAKGTIITDFVESTDPVEIPDASAPDIQGETLESYLAVDQAGAIESLIVFLDISHEDISELVVTIVSPEGTSCTLHNRTPGQNLIGAFHIEDSFLGENPKGTWTLRITDYVPDNKGTLNSWSLTINLVSDTVPGTWATDLSPMPSPRGWLGSSGSPVSDGMIYVFGPDTAYGYVPEADSWIDLEPMPGPAVGVATINGSIYAIGPEQTYEGIPSHMEGDNDIPGPQIEPWIETTRLPQPMATFWWAGKQLIIKDGRVYVFGGYNAENGMLVNVYYSVINSDGSLGPWIETTSMPGIYFDRVVLRVGDYAYLITGASGAVDVYYAHMESDGSVGEWTATAALYPSRQNFAAVSYGEYIYISGGNAGGTRDFVKFTSVKPDGSLNPWVDTTHLPEVMEGHTMAAYGGYLYVLAPNSAVYYAPINSDGTVGNWTSTTSLPESMSRYSTLEHNGYLYLLGGTSQSNYHVQILADGSIGDWQTTTSLPAQQMGLLAGAHGNFLYAVGGYDGSSYLDTVHYAPLQDAWIEKNPIPVSVEAFGYAVLNGQIYIIGGDISGSSSTTVQRYTPATDTWEADTNHGGTLAALPLSRSSLYCGVINGKIHAIGGRNDADPTCDHFIYDPDSNIWSAGPPIPQCFIGQFAATLNNTIYVFGGDRGAIFKYSEEGGWSSGVPMPTDRVYGTAAVYNGKIYVIGGEAQGQAVDVVEVYDPGSDNAIALFTENPRKGLAPLTVQFNAISDQATDWVWNFGDEYNSTPGSGKQPTHTYSQPGNYTVSLTATGQSGSGTVTKPAHIQVGMSTGPGDSSSSFKWTALALSGEDADTPPIASDSENSMTIFVGHPVIGGISLEGYVSQTRRGDQIMWSGPLPIQ